MESESPMAMMEEEVSRMDALQQEKESRAATDAEIQRILDREDARDHVGRTLDAYLEKLSRRFFGIDAGAAARDIKREVDRKHIIAEELNVRFDMLRAKLTQAYEHFQQVKRENNTADGIESKNGYFRLDEQGEPIEFFWEYKNPTVEAARQQALQAKAELETFVNEELYEGSDKTYRDSTKAQSFKETLRDLDMIGM